MNIDLYKKVINLFSYEYKRDIEWIPSHYTKNINFSNIPNNVQKLIINTFDDIKEVIIEKDSIPNHIIELDLTCNKQKLEPNIIPNTIKCLKFSYNFELEEGVIPYGVETLIFDNFNQKLKKGDIPNSIKILCLSQYFAQDIEEGAIPNSVIKMDFCYGSCPSSLKISKRIIPNVLPNSIKELHLPYYYNYDLELGVIPHGVELLDMRDYNRHLKPGVIPNSVKKLSLGYGVSMNYRLISGIIPYGVEELSLPSYHNHKLKSGIIPNSVKILNFGNKFNQILKKGDIPNSVEYLYFGDDYNRKLNNNSIPSSVKYLHLGCDFNQILEKGDIPYNVEYLSLSRKYNQKIEQDVIPNSVKYFKIGSEFNKQIGPNIIPNSVTHLTLPYTIKENLKVGDIPNSVLFLAVYFGIEENMLPDKLIELVYIDVLLDYDRFHSFNYDKVDDNIKSKNIIISSSGSSYSFYKNIKYNMLEIDEPYYQYKTENCEMYNFYGNRHYDFIHKYLTNDKLIGRIIFEELVAKVFNPNRLLKLCKKHDLTFEEINDIY